MRSSAATLAELTLGAHGPLARALPGFRARAVQQRMAARIELALHSREALLVEAGTGTGKTYAYLVPALQSQMRVLISTGTRTLQDQLFHRDLPRLAAALGRPVRIALLKGRTNYLCRARLELAGRQERLLPEADDLLVTVLDWSERTRSGDLAEIGALPESHPLRSQLTSTRESCTGAQCAQFSRCHVFEARRAAAEADIVVVNHHLLLADLALKEEGYGDLLPSADALILDEAHQLPELLGEVFGLSVSSRQIELFVADLQRAEALATDARAGHTPARAPEGAAGRAAVEDGLVRLRACLREPGLSSDPASVRSRPLSSEACQAAARLAADLERCAGALESAGAHGELAACAQRARALGETLAQISAEHSAALGARTASVGLRGFTLRLLPYEVATRFRAVVTATGSAWILTSATLAVAGDFTHFARRLGLEEAATLSLESPFDYEHQALMYLPRGLPDPSAPGFTAAVVQASLALIEAAGGGAFLLFTSHRALREAAEALEPRIAEAGRRLLVQGSAPREQLLRRFRLAGDAVLLGAASFWEGVDVQGLALRLVIIDRLPFASPEDPVVRARIEHLTAQGLSAFRDYQLPEAVLALKQGVGRLIRSESDRGVVAICDPRLISRGYGRVFRASLPPMSCTQEAQPVLEWLNSLRPRPASEPAVG